MNAFLLAAGKGSRMRPLSDHLPKPLLPVAGQTLIERHLYKLRDSGFTRVVVNLHYLGDQLRSALGNGERYDLDIQYSHEQTLLDTGGGIRAGLELLGGKAFAVISSDIYCDFPFDVLKKIDLGHCLGHLILVPNPEHHPAGDFSITDNLIGNGGERYTFSVAGRAAFSGSRWQTEWSAIPWNLVGYRHTLSTQVAGKLVTHSKLGVCEAIL
jgi:MurNAc alpha-1-phosphate uridylyltransferase